MAAKLCLVLVLAMIAISFAHPTLDKYIETPVTGKEEVRQQCFVQYVLSDAINRYETEAVENELAKDKEEIRTYIGIEHASNPDSGACYNTAYYCSRIGAFERKRENTIQKFYDAVCHRWSKFDRLCDLVRDRRSADRQVMAVESWVCQVSEDSAAQQREDNAANPRRDSVCRASVQRSAYVEADAEFYKVIVYTPEELERAKKALEKEVAAEFEARAAHNVAVAKEAKQLIRERVTKHFGDFSKCWAQKDAQEAIIAQSEAKEAEEAKEMRMERKKKGLLGKMSKCVGSSCS